MTSVRSGVRPAAGGRCRRLQERELIITTTTKNPHKTSTNERLLTHTDIKSQCKFPAGPYRTLTSSLPMFLSEFNFTQTRITAASTWPETVTRPFRVMSSAKNWSYCSFRVDYFSITACPDVFYSSDITEISCAHECYTSYKPQFLFFSLKWKRREENRLDHYTHMIGRARWAVAMGTMTYYIKCINKKYFSQTCFSWNVIYINDSMLYFNHRNEIAEEVKGVKQDSIVKSPRDKRAHTHADLQPQREPEYQVPVLLNVPWPVWSPDVYKHWCLLCRTQRLSMNAP